MTSLEVRPQKSKRLWISRGNRLPQERVLTYTYCPENSSQKMLGEPKGPSTIVVGDIFRKADYSYFFFWVLLRDTRFLLVTRICFVISLIHNPLTMLSHWRYLCLNHCQSPLMNRDFRIWSFVYLRILNEKKCFSSHSIRTPPVIWERPKGLWSRVLMNCGLKNLGTLVDIKVLSVRPLPPVELLEFETSVGSDSR